jgi:hypothetical protein
VSGFLAAAAQALNAPEVLVQRSAEARSKATGTPVEAILEAWAGGAAVATPAPPPVAAPEPQPAPAAAPEPQPEPHAEPAPAAPQPVTPAAAPTVTVSTAPAEPPVLVGRNENPMRTLAAALGLAALALLIGFVAPALPSEGNGVYTSATPLSESGIEGRDIYLREGCASCHTQQVRPIVADAGLGGVTVSDSNQVLGSRRYGPDLAHVGARVEDAADLDRVLSGTGHPSYTALGNDDLAALAAYLTESK